MTDRDPFHLETRTLPQIVQEFRSWLLTWERRGLLAVPRPVLPPEWVQSQPEPASAHASSASPSTSSSPSPQPAAPSIHAPVPPSSVPVAPKSAPVESEPAKDHFQPQRPPLEVLGAIEAQAEAQRKAPAHGVQDVPEMQAQGTRRERLNAFYEAIGQCQRCGLAKGRTRLVFGSGNPDSGVMLIGEGPGRYEDLEGLPFVGRSGLLLTKMLASIGLDRDQDIFITNIIKCRPPNNRDPEPDEVNSCHFILKAQLEVVQPKIIVIAGLQAAKALLGPNVTLSGIRQRRQQLGNSQVLATYHPSFLLRTPSKKAEAWRDLVALRLLLAELGMAPPAPKAWWQ